MRSGAMPARAGRTPIDASAGATSSVRVAPTDRQRAIELSDALDRA